MTAQPTAPPPPALPPAELDGLADALVACLIQAYAQLTDEQRTDARPAPAVGRREAGR